MFALFTAEHLPVCRLNPVRVLLMLKLFLMNVFVPTRRSHTNLLVPVHAEEVGAL